MVGMVKEWWWQRRRGGRRAKQWPPTGMGVDSGKGVCGGDDNGGVVGFR